MKLVDLKPETIEILRSWRYDRIIEKHEGPEDWSSIFEYYAPELTEIEGRPVLLPVEGDRVKNITVLRSYMSEDGQIMTAFLKDRSLAEYYSDDIEMFWAGFVAICERVPTDDGLFAATFYHEWFIVDNSEKGGL